jgi:hypothetical protein
MDAELKSKWLTALRNGQYAQGRNFLRRNSDGTDGFCCLGVLCDLVDPTKWMGESDGGTRVYSEIEGGRCWAPITVEHAAKMTHDESITLAKMNDDGKSFAEIADYIEAKL